MNKRLCIIILLTLTNVALFSAYKTFNPINPTSAAQPAAPQYVIYQGQTATQPAAAKKTIDSLLPTPNSLTLDQIQQGYALQPTNDLKAQYINYILDTNDGNPTIHQKIEQTQNLAKIIANDLSLHTGWLYNDNQSQVDWLREQRTKIAQRLNRLEWQGTHWGLRALYNTALIGTACFGVLLLASLVQDQYEQNNENYEPRSTGDLAWMPIEKIIDLAQDAVIPAQYIGNAAYEGGVMALAAGQAVKNYIQEAGEGIIVNGAERAQKDLHDFAQDLVKKTSPTPPSWKDIAQNYVNPQNEISNNQQKDNGDTSRGTNNQTKSKEPSKIQSKSAKPESTNAKTQGSTKKTEPKEINPAPKVVSVWDWLNSPFLQWEHNREKSLAIGWKKELEDAQLERSKYKDEINLEANHIRNEVMAELKHYKAINDPNAEHKANQLYSQKMAKLERKKANEELASQEEFYKLQTNMPEYIKKERQLEEKAILQKLFPENMIKTVEAMPIAQQNQIIIKHLTKDDENMQYALLQEPQLAQTELIKQLLRTI